MIWDLPVATFSPDPHYHFQYRIRNQCFGYKKPSVEHYGSL